MMPAHIEVRRHPWADGLIYTLVGGADTGRTLTLADYCALVDSGVPVHRIA